MSASFILRYSASALLFAAAVTGLWLLVQRLRGKRGLGRGEAPRLLLVAYLAALIQVTALRLGLVRPRWLRGSLRPFPLKTLLETTRLGPWMFVYHTAGNLLWFAPLGILLPLADPGSDKWACLRAGALLSAAIEAAQFALGTGVCDVDDVLLNALGALAGWSLLTLWRRGKRGGGGPLHRRKSML